MQSSFSASAKRPLANRHSPHFVTTCTKGACSFLACVGTFFARPRRSRPLFSEVVRQPGPGVGRHPGPGCPFVSIKARADHTFSRAPASCQTGETLRPETLGVPARGRRLAHLMVVAWGGAHARFKTGSVYGMRRMIFPSWSPRSIRSWADRASASANTSSTTGRALSAATSSYTASKSARVPIVDP
jgi:hypothetical protein